MLVQRFWGFCCTEAPARDVHGWEEPSAAGHRAAHVTASLSAIVRLLCVRRVVIGRSSGVSDGAEWLHNNPSFLCGTLFEVHAVWASAGLNVRTSLRGRWVNTFSGSGFCAAVEEPADECLEERAAVDLAGP